jgi:diguanylate cyclase (GGDEF)-like protein
VRERVSSHTARLGEAVTISVGVATMPQMGTTPEQLVLSADAALYAAKLEGRQQLVLGGDPLDR